MSFPCTGCTRTVPVPVSWAVTVFSCLWCGKPYRQRVTLEVLEA